MDEKPAAGRRGVREVVVEEAFSGQRVDNFLRKELKGVPKSRIYRILRRGEVRVNRGRIKPDYRLRTGDVVRIPPLRQASPAEHDVRLGMVQGRRLEGRTLFEDEDIWVVDKPAGMAVHGGSGVSLGVIEAARQLRPEIPYLELAHRLDRDTSGCLVLAKRRRALKWVHDALRGGRAEKEYLALVAGRLQGRRHTVDVALRKNVLRSGERMVRTDPAGKSARSIFYRLSSGDEATLVRVVLVTGRTHQIRVHAAHLGHHLAGDQKYGDPGFNARAAALGLRRLFLHAWRLRVPLGEGPPLAVTAPLPEDLTGVAKAFGLECSFP